VTEEKEKQIKLEVAPTTTSISPATVKNKPRKRGCLVAGIIVGAILIFIFLISQFLPFIGIFWGGDNSDVPNLPTDTAKNSSTDSDKAQTPSAKKTTGSSSNTPQYSKDDYINYFTQLAIRNGSDTLGRFNKSPVYLKVEGNIPAGSDAMLNDVIADFNGLSNSIKIERNQAGSDI